MHLAIDIGNTRTKAAVFEGESLLEQVAFFSADANTELSRLCKSFPQITDAVLSSVGASQNLEMKGVCINQVSRKWSFPFENLYATPDTLGLDRMVLAAGAVLMHPRKNVLVIDAGTCVTYDYVDRDARYHGGAISPGLAMRYRALRDYTAGLPLLDAAVPVSMTGDSTANSIHSGVVNGLAAEVESFINHYASAGNFIIILTGGDSEFLAGTLKNRIFANPNFLLESLNRLFQYQITK